ncbi:MAG: OmpA family protein [Cyclobacteriaceae bacterium]|nr:OmpA family protein [Cyclobacteriaceae bacterium]
MKYWLLTLFTLYTLTTLAQEISPRYELVKMSNKVNTLYHEVSPVISVDGTRLYYFVSNHPSNTYGKDQSQDIWFSTLGENGDWTEGKRMAAPLNQNRYNQVFNALPDGSLLVRGGQAKNSKGFSIVTSGGSWRELVIPGFATMDKGLFNGATISGDGKNLVLYFSEKPGDKFSDLYLSQQQANGQWTKPVKLKLSSAADDYSPFISPDQKTLYFSSDRFSKDKVGGTDIYKSTRLDDTWLNWSEPVNLGRSINTPAGDAYFSIDSHGNIFTARSGARVDGGNFDLFILKPRDVKITIAGVTYNDRTKQPLATIVDVIGKEQKPINLKTTTNGSFDTRIAEVDSYIIKAQAAGFMPYEKSFVMPKVNRDTTLRVELFLTPIDKPIILTGDLLDKKSTKRVDNARLQIALKSDRSINFGSSAEAGKYEQIVPGVGWYLLTASAEGYITANDSVQVMNDKVTPIVKNIFLTPIEVGLTVRLKNIYFDFDKTTLKSESFTELNKVVDFLNQNGNVSIEISGHTDSKGSDTYNLNLSQGRSQAVVDYLISQGIDSSRLQAKGYGESKPIDTNDTEAGRANNRRVEFTVLKI